MNDPISWLRPILTEEESDANGLIEAVAEARSKGLSSTIWDEQEADARRALRQVQAHRAILDLHRPDGQRENWFWQQRRCAECGKLWHKWTPDRPPTEIGPEVGCTTLRALVSIYSDRDGYRTEWATPESTPRTPSPPADS